VQCMEDRTHQFHLFFRLISSTVGHERRNRRNSSEITA